MSEYGIRHPLSDRGPEIIRGEPRWELWVDGRDKFQQISVNNMKRQSRQQQTINRLAYENAALRRELEQTKGQK